MLENSSVALIAVGGAFAVVAAGSAALGGRGRRR